MPVGWTEEASPEEAEVPYQDPVETQLSGCGDEAGGTSEASA